MSPRGRPRQPDLERRIIDAVAELVPVVGYSRLTVDQVVARAGTSKPAFYRRFADVAQVIPHILAERFGTDDDIDTGSIVTDLLEVQRRQCALFDDPLTRRALCGYLDAVSTTPDAAAPFVAGYIAPRRAFTSVMIARAVDRGEIEPYDDAAYIADLLTGPALMRGVMPGMAPIDAALVRRTVGTTLTELGYAGDRTALTTGDADPAGISGPGAAAP